MADGASHSGTGSWCHVAFICFWAPGGPHVRLEGRFLETFLSCWQTTVVSRPQLHNIFIWEEMGSLGVVVVASRWFPSLSEEGSPRACWAVWLAGLSTTWGVEEQHELIADSMGC